MKRLNADAIVDSKDSGPFQFTLDVILNTQYDPFDMNGVHYREAKLFCQVLQSFSSSLRFV